MARELYLAGLPASEVAARLGVSEHNLRKKATREGWSRRAHAELVIDLRLPKVGGDRRPAGEASALPAAPAPEAEEPAFDVEADPAEAADALARRAAGAALAGRTGEAQGLLKAAEGLRRAAEAALPAAGRWDDAERWDDEEPRASDARNWRRVGAEADAPGWADPPADPRDRRPCDGPVVAALPWTDARPPCTAGTCYVRASEAVIEGALAQMAVLFDREPDKASARAQAHALNLVERLGRLAASGLPEQARALYAAGWALGLAEGPGSGGAPGAAAGAAAGGTAWEGAGSDAVPFPPPEPQAMSTNKHPSAGHEPDPLPADDLATNPGIGESRGVTRAGGLTQEREDPADIEGDNTVEGDVDQDVDRGGGISPDHRGRNNK